MFRKLSKHLIIFLFFFSFFLPKALKAENDSLKFINNLGLEIKLQYGAVYPHHELIKYVVDKKILGAEFLLSTQSYGKNVWDKLYRYPRYGMGYLFTSLGNTQVHGNAHSAFLSLEIPFSSKKSRLRSSYQICGGMAYLDKVFDPIENPLNVAISTHFNIYASIRLNLSYDLGNQNEINLGLLTSHYSNGKMGTPNRGINTVAMQLGFRGNIIPERFSRSMESADFPIHRQNLVIVFSGGYKVDDQLTGKLYPISTLVGDYTYDLSKKYAIGGGVDIFYDAAIGPNIESKLKLSYSPADLFRIGLHGGISVRISKMQFILQAGRYLYANNLWYTQNFFRLGFRYNLTPVIVLNMSIKSHWAVADYFEWGIGYRFKLGKESAYE